jgi:RNA polymerase sigma-B factor
MTANSSTAATAIPAGARRFAEMAGPGAHAAKPAVAGAHAVPAATGGQAVAAAARSVESRAAGGAAAHAIGPHGNAPSRASDEASLLGLFERWQRSRDRNAREQLVERYMPLARSLARRYLGTLEPIEDLTQVAYLGMIKAIDRFDPARGHRFAAFAVPTILGELRRHFRDTCWAVHVPRQAQERALEVERANEALATRRGHSPTVGEIAQYLECDQEEVLDALQVSHARGALSLDAPRPGAADEDAEPRSETLGSVDEHYELVEDGSAVAAAFAALGERERRILALRFGREMSQTEIATEIGLSQMQISRVLRAALERMRTIASGVDDTATGGPSTTT